jgi:NAD-specific glutamate dehydrogenase
MPRPLRIARDEGQVDLDRVAQRQIAFRLLRRVLQALERHRVAAQIEAARLVEPFDEVLHDAAVEILAAEEGVARGREDLEHAVGHLEDGNVEGPAAEVVDRDLLLARAIHAVGERRRSRLVDDAQDLEARDLAGVLRALPLRVVEVGGDRDHRLLHRLREVLVRAANDLVGAEVDRLLDFRVLEAPTDQALGREDRVARVRDRLALGQMADETLAVLGDPEHRGRRLVPSRVRDHRGLTVLDHRHARVRRPEIDSDHPAHRLPPLAASKAAMRMEVTNLRASRSFRSSSSALSNARLAAARSPRLCSMRPSSEW